MGMLEPCHDLHKTEILSARCQKYEAGGGG